MKVIVQIPCFNEEATLPQTVRDIPRSIPGVDAVEILVVDDGSTDRTAAVAAQLGVEHIVRHRRNRGLAGAFATALERALALGADIVVNTDADNQYAGADVAKLVEPILAGSADIVVGDRQTAGVAGFSPGKRLLQAVGSSVVRRMSGTAVPDAVSGFRAISREAALKLNTLSTFSYTTEMLIQAGASGLSVVSVPVRTNPKTRESRLFRSIPEFVARSGATMLRAYTMYRALRVFVFLGAALVVAGSLPILRFLWHYAHGEGQGKVQSLVLGGALLTIGFVTFLFGIVADLVSQNRRLLEACLERLRRLELVSEARDGATAPTSEAAAEPRPGR